MQSKYKNRSDRILLIAMIFLVVLGILAVFSASSFRGAEKYGDSAYFLKMHLQLHQNILHEHNLKYQNHLLR